MIIRRLFALSIGIMSGTANVAAEECHRLSITVSGNINVDASLQPELEIPLDAINATGARLRLKLASADGSNWHASAFNGLTSDKALAFVGPLTHVAFDKAGKQTTEQTVIAQPFSDNVAAAGSFVEVTLSGLTVSSGPTQLQYSSKAFAVMPCSPQGAIDVDNAANGGPDK